MTPSPRQDILSIYDPDRQGEDGPYWAKIAEDLSVFGNIFYREGSLVRTAHYGMVANRVRVRVRHPHFRVSLNFKVSWNDRAGRFSYTPWSILRGDNDENRAYREIQSKEFTVQETMFGDHASSDAILTQDVFERWNSTLAWPSHHPVPLTFSDRRAVKHAVQEWNDNLGAAFDSGFDTEAEKGAFLDRMISLCHSSEVVRPHDFRMNMAGVRPLWFRGKLPEFSREPLRCPTEMLSTSPVVMFSGIYKPQTWDQDGSKRYEAKNFLYDGSRIYSAWTDLYHRNAQLFAL